MKVQLISPRPDRGFAFNEGAYWPVGLVAIGSVLRRAYRGLEVEILDGGLGGATQVEESLGADIVGIQASSNLTYRRVLELALRAKMGRGAFVVLGGPYASLMAAKILEARPFVDAVVAGPGEMPMVGIVGSVLRGKGRGSVAEIPGVWVRNTPQLEPRPSAPWSYEAARPLDYSLIPVAQYHHNYRQRLSNDYEGCFQIFTHFGCRYRDLRRSAGRKWCTYCALGDGLALRRPEDVRDEIREALAATGMAKGSRLMLKCYGDNASALGEAALLSLAACLKEAPDLRNFELAWSVYAQSSFVNPRVVEAFSRLGVEEVYVGFDSVDDGIQRLNGLGTSRATHMRAARLLSQAGIRLQAGFVLGCEGESPETLIATAQFCEELQSVGNVDLFHSSPLVVLAGSPSFDRLSTKIPEMLGNDYVDPEELQREWLGRFCPALGSGEEGQRKVREAAASIASLGRLRSAFGGGG